MALKQLSVFLENREGRLEDLFSVINDNNIAVESFSLAENAEYGVLRLIVSDAEAAKSALKEKDFSASITDVIGVRLKGGFNDLKNVTDSLPKDLNIEYIYVLSTNEDSQSIVFKTKKVEEAEKVLRENGFDII